MRQTAAVWETQVLNALDLSLTDVIFMMDKMI